MGKPQPLPSFTGEARAAVPGSEDRNGAVDIVRFLGALAIVWFHERMPYHFIAYSALPVFMGFLVYFALVTRERTSNTRIRAERLLVPWLAWSLIFGVLKIADAAQSNAPLASEFEVWMLLTGPKIHLWFLPAAFFAGWGLCALAPYFARSSRFWLLLTLYFLAQTGMCYVLTHYTFPYPFYQWLFVSPACLLGVAMWAAGGSRVRLILVLAAAALSYEVTAAFVWWHGSMHGLIAAAACTLALLTPLRSNQVTSTLAGISLGIYLAHPFVHAVLLRLPSPEPGTLSFTLAVAVISILLVLLLKRVPLARQIV